MSPERAMPSKELMQFTTMMPEQGVNRFFLEGAEGKHVFMHTVVGLYERPTNIELPMFGVEYFVESPWQLRKPIILSDILHIEVPKRLQQYPNDEVIKQVYKDFCIQRHLPTSALMFGFEIDEFNHLTTNPSTLLFTIRGQTPSESLRNFQTIARMELAVNN